MTTTSPARTAAVRGRPAQGGYVLLTTIAAMFIGLTVLTILLTVAFNATRVQNSLVTEDREVRAAEGALNIAINQVRNNPNTPPYRDPNVVPDTFPRYLDCLQVNPEVVVDGIRVRVGCEAAAFSGSPQVPTNDNQVAVRLVGDQYSTTARTGSTCSPATQDTTRQPNTPAYGSFTDSPSNWRSNAGLAATIGTGRPGFDAEICATRGQLLHLGPVPLRVVGGVEVRHQVVASRTAATDGPAIDAFGPVVQGGGALFADSSSRTVGTDPGAPTFDPRCGVGEVDDTWNVAGADVSSYSELAAPNDGYTCNLTRLQSLNPGGAPSPAGDWTNSSVQVSTPTGSPGSPLEGANPRFSNPGSLDCENWSVAGGGVIVLRGAYDAEQTKILNAWFTTLPSGQTSHRVVHNEVIYNVGACPNRTFLIDSDSWFDVFDPRTVNAGGTIVNRDATDPKRHSLVIDNRESNWVVGSQNGLLGWNPSAGQRAPNDRFPNRICVNQTEAPTATVQSGGSITLSSRTSIHHLSGRVAMCGVRNPGQTFHNTAIWQRPSTGLGARLLPNNFVDDGNWTADNNTNAGKLAVLRETGGSRNAIRTVIPFPNIFNIQWVGINFNGCGIFDLGCYFSRIFQFFVDNVNAVGTSLCWVRGDCGLESPPGSGNPAPGYQNLKRTFTAQNFRVPVNATTNTDLPALDISNQPVYVDLAVDNNGWANNAGRNIAYTRIVITRSNGGSCTQTYTGNPPNFRLGDEFAVISYNVTDNNYGNCRSVLTDRDQLEGANVQVTFNVNPPAFITDQFVLGCTTVFNWLKALAQFLGFSWPDCPLPPGSIIDVDGIALRTEWAPQVDSGVGVTPPAGYSISPVNGVTSADGFPVPGNCIFAINCAVYQTPATQETAGPGSGTYISVGARRDGSFARANGGTNGLSQANLTYTMNDDNLRDGFLPLTDLVISTRMARSPDLDFGGTNPTRLDFVFRLPRPNPDGTDRVCTVSLSGTTLSGNFGTDQGAAVDRRIRVLGTAQAGEITPTSNNCGSALSQIGDLVGYGAGAGRRQAQLRVYTAMKRSASAPAPPGGQIFWDIDYVSVGATTESYLRPPQPMRVTWNPRPLNTDGTARETDAVFGVFGTTSVPDNAVEVRWRSTGSATGTALFNGASLPVPSGQLSRSDCVVPGNTSGCRPGLIAGALASWVENAAGTDPNVAWIPPIDTSRLPDPIATSGANRPPDRNVRLTACVVRDDRGTSANEVDDLIYPRAAANVRIRDVANNVFRPGAVVTITRWDHINQEYLQTGSTSNSDPRVQINSCYRPADENP